MRTLIIVPTFEEATNVEPFLAAIRDAVPAADILIVDDSSPDGTADLAERAGAELGQVKVLRRPKKDGLGNAYRAGFGVGMDEGYETLVQMDVDFSHDPAQVPAMLAKIDEGAGVVIGSRYVPGGSTPHWPWYRRALSKWGNRYAGVMLGLPIRDATSGFRAYRGEVLRDIHYQDTVANGYAFQMEVAYLLSKWGGPVQELPIEFTDRVRGVSKMSAYIMAEDMLLVTWWGIRDRALKLWHLLPSARRA
jgi:dolichol-phosphate mannosyltransferase